MNSKIIKIFLSLLLGVALFTGSTFAEGGDGKDKSNTLYKPGDPIRAYMNINFVSTIIKNDGISDINVGQDASGLIFPRGSGQTAVYTSGFLWGANVNDPAEQDPHIGGTVYRTGLQPGWIDGAGNVIPDTDPRSRIFRVRPDVWPGLTTEDVTKDQVEQFSRFRRGIDGVRSMFSNFLITAFSSEAAISGMNKALLFGPLIT